MIPSPPELLRRADPLRRPFFARSNTQLTGLWPFFENEDDAIVQGKVTRGDRPFMAFHQYRSHEERSMVETMKRGWEHKSSKRIDIFDLVRSLRAAKNTVIV